MAPRVAPMLRRARECAAQQAMVKLNLPRPLAERAAWWRWRARGRGETGTRVIRPDG